MQTEPLTPGQVKALFKPLAYTALQSGHHKNKQQLLIGDTPDARTSTFLFDSATTIRSKQATQITLENGKVLTRSSGQVLMLERLRVYPYALPNELIEDLWQRQIERKRILDLCRDGRPIDLPPLLKEIARLTNSSPGVLEVFNLERFNIEAIHCNLLKLSLRELREVSGMTKPTDSQMNQP
ncbi:MAG: hypothetical protein K2X03_03735 [Bryobacteraceae bacterium]|nr:hypothetical protein [Bryobacteraceae bacterium]